MIEAMYHLLESVGFVHPLHPAMTHIPMGMAMGGFVFALIFFLLEKEEFLRTAYYCISFGLAGILPTVVFGFTDWQYRFGGEWNFLIVMKMIFAVLLTASFFMAIKFSLSCQENHKKILFIYALCLAFATGLGFMGGELQYG
ncbi:hypothetical protein SAMN02746065_10576 [Desulfocicer vacuolatum DSM 3385]|uniref:DUF2231 domain-containing protein n=1 Tax=Desulfocicer vacuolatum DSM 3385 TaxID=1121400 RepID=A0A1W2AGW9_9BACT|nr:DUF2231 domain-containing protein [Desulfocicer vacuolatum]SMC59945.1 hypothetical protein SAMN02746065_10576 [Desulfocicer vacuolatum DSM 3385]